MEERRRRSGQKQFSRKETLCMHTGSTQVAFIVWWRSGMIVKRINRRRSLWTTKKRDWETSHAVMFGQQRRHETARTNVEINFQLTRRRGPGKKRKVSQGRGARDWGKNWKIETSWRKKELWSIVKKRMLEDRLAMSTGEDALVREYNVIHEDMEEGCRRWDQRRERRWGRGPKKTRKRVGQGKLRCINFNLKSGLSGGLS